MKLQKAENRDADDCGTFITAYEACIGYLKPLLDANGHTDVFGEGIKVPRAGHRYQTRGGSIRDRTTRSIARSQKSARTAPSRAPWGMNHG